jgi:hypothetical protein
MLFNAGPGDVSFVLPGDAWGVHWQRLLDTGMPAPDGLDGPVHDAGAAISLGGKAVVLLRRVD